MGADYYICTVSQHTVWVLPRTLGRRMFRSTRSIYRDEAALLGIPWTGDLQVVCDLDDGYPPWFSGENANRGWRWKYVDERGVAARMAETLVNFARKLRQEERRARGP